MEEIEEKDLEKVLNSFVGQEVTITINGVISLDIVYEEFRYLLNISRLLISDKRANEINIDFSFISKILCNDKSVKLFLENSEEALLEL